MRKTLILIILFAFPAISCAQDSINIMFWNLENYFDYFDDPNTNDDQFTPMGEYHWTKKKFQTKRNSIAKTIMAAGGDEGEYPVIVGLAEVENLPVLNRLLSETPLSKLEYQVIHRNSPDKRGIDVAILYREGCFRPSMIKTLRVKMPPGRNPTRDILYVKGDMGEKQYHIFVIHWPSKSGGEKFSYPGRMAAAETLSAVTDSLIMNIENPNIIVMGDFNDTPDSDAVRHLTSHGLSSLAIPLFEKGMGTIKYQGKWEMIDQFVTARHMARLKMNIFDPGFLLEEDIKNLDVKPYRTYLGPVYHGGISDHLPIILRIAF